MPIPPPPPPPGGPPPPPTFSQANTTPPKLSRQEAKGRGALLSDICKGTKLKKVAVVNDRSAPLLDSKTQTPKSQTPPTEHPYIRLYQYLHQNQNQPKQQGVLSEEPKKTAGHQSSAPSLQKPKGGGASTGANGSAAGSLSGSAPPIGGQFMGGVPKMRPVGDGSSGRSSTRGAAPRPPSHRHDDTECPSPHALLAVDTSRSQRPSLPNLSSSPSPSTPSSAASSPSTGMKHSSSAPPPPPPPFCRRGNAPSPPCSSYNREKPLPPTPNNTPPLPSKPPLSPSNNRRPPTSGGNPAPSSSSLAPPPPTYCFNSLSGGSEAAPELPQRHNSLSNKRPAPSPGGHTPTRGPAPPPPPASPTPSQHGLNRPPPPVREASSRGAAPLAPVQPSSRAGGREAPPPPPYRTHDDFESKYSFHPLDDFPPPDEYRHVTKIYPSKASRVMRGAPPLPPVGR
ncbi:WAS/WASL-interacting protein family member 2b isoform X2 [Nematolebias whitei]|uniref:WAS/WASL-interacting protein family member 2b isoform X2 n=1 Tax=Nematolebias whitei TaxID=451745 RepID=UPI001899A254|nr:WAS/WASL-interacting protein family member 2b isoform X2 [Nematolebias whitei]